MRRGGSGSGVAGAGAEIGRAHRRRSIGMGRHNRSGSRRGRVLDERLGPGAVVDEDARGKGREERQGHDECRFHGHGETGADLAKRVLTMCFTRIEMDLPSKKRLDS
jgi:hypothetical protein